MSAGTEQGAVIETATAIEPVGTILAAARRERGIELDAVSKELNIARRFLEALERDNFDALPGSTYAIGFVRSYGDYLGLDTETLTRAVKRHCRPEPVQPPTFTPEPAEELRRPALSIVMVTGFAFAGILVGWKIVTSGAEEGAITPPAAAAIGEYVSDKTGTAPAPAENRVAQAAAAVVEEGDGPVDAKLATAEPQETVEKAMIGEFTTAVPASSETVADAQANAQRPAEDDAKAQADATTLVADAGETNNTDVADTPEKKVSLTDETTPSTQTSETGNVEISGKRDTWVLITDLNEETLFDGIIRAGESFRPPKREGLLLTTGDATGLTVSIGSRRFDLPKSPAETIVEVRLEPQELVAFSRAGGGP